MVSSTAAQSAVRITCAVSEEPTLQMRCLEFISKHPALYKRYKEIPGLIRLYERKYFWIVPTNGIVHLSVTDGPSNERSLFQKTTKRSAFPNWKKCAP